jgi:hypothetical protein
MIFSCWFSIKPTFFRSNAIIVAASQYPLGKRRPHSSAISILLVQISILIFEPVSNEHVVLGLFHHWNVQMVLLTDLDGLSYLGSTPFRCTPVKSKAFINEP